MYINIKLAHSAEISDAMDIDESVFINKTTYHRSSKFKLIKR